MKRSSNLERSNPKKTLIFILVAAGMMIVIDLFFLGGIKHFMRSETLDYEGSEHMQAPVGVPVEEWKTDQGDEPVPEVLEEEIIFEELPYPEPYEPPQDLERPERESRSLIDIPTERRARTDWKSFSGPHFNKENQDGSIKKIALIIDDMGLDRKRNAEVLALPANLTLAYLPYAPDLKEETAAALLRGHELLIHVPMEPINLKNDMGELGLATGMSEEDFNGHLKEILQSFNGYVGINNHMGSRLTQDREAMARIMTALAERDLLFVDSKTIHNSVAAEQAAAYGLNYAQRDVFLDHVATPESVLESLKKLEEVAMRKGYAVGIGHPKDATIAGLRAWLPGLTEKGIEIVPVSALVTRSEGENISSASNLETPLDLNAIAPAAGPVQIDHHP